jgi:hypothetical protein
MGIEVLWHAADSNVIRMVVEGGWTWEEFYTALAEAHALVEASPYGAVDYIIDMRHGQTLPQNVLSRMKRVCQNRHPKSRKMVVVGAGRFAVMMFEAMEKIAPKQMQQIRLVRTMEEALVYLQGKHGAE